MNKVLEKIPMSEVCTALYRDRFSDKTTGFALLNWSEFKISMFRTGTVSTLTTARAKWFKLCTIPEIFHPQSTADLVAVDIANLRAIAGDIDIYTHKTEEVIRW